MEWSCEGSANRGRVTDEQRAAMGPPLRRSRGSQTLRDVRIQGSRASVPHCTGATAGCDDTGSGDQAAAARRIVVPAGADASVPSLAAPPAPSTDGRPFRDVSSFEPVDAARKSHIGCLESPEVWVCQSAVWPPLHTAKNVKLTFYISKVYASKRFKLHEQLGSETRKLKNRISTPTTTAGSIIPKRNASPAAFSCTASSSVCERSIALYLPAFASSASRASSFV